MKKFMLLFICVMLFVVVGVAYADSGEGYFGDGDVIDANPEPTGDSSKPFIPPMPDEEELEEEDDVETIEPLKPAKETKWKKAPEKYSDDTTKVINSYGLGNKAKNLINRHKEAAAGMGNKEKVSRYSAILKQFPMDYLAAYRAAEASFAMGRNSQALKWVNQSLAIYPDYMPARRLKKQIEGALK